MALRSPVPFHNFWGATFTLSTDLPNVTASATQNPNLQAGDFAYVTGTSSFWLCTDPTLNAAIWVQITTGAAGIDRFAPKHLVGNQLSGDPNTDFNANGFWYWTDDGSGTGIAAALAAAATTPGDVWIRPGTYNLAAEDLPLVVPANTRVQGAGATTVINKFVADENSVFTVFQLQDEAELRDVAITQIVNPGTYAITGFGAVEVVPTPSGQELVPSSAHVERVSVTVANNQGQANWITAFYVPSTCSLEADRCEATLTGTNTPDGGDNVFSGWRSVAGTLRLDACRSTGGNTAVQSASGETSVDQCAFAEFDYIGVLSAASTLSVTGGTVIRSTSNTPALVGISATDTGTLLVNARITLPNAANSLQIGIDAAVDSGQVFGSRIEASNGIVSGSAGPAGLAIGFNNVISSTAHITSTAFDEVAHNILT